MRPISGKFLADGLRSKHGFVNRVHGFANWAMRCPGMPVLPAVALGVALIGTLAGGFGTGALPQGQRLAFWLILMGLETIKWLGWLRWQVREPSDYWRAALIGTPLLGLLIPVEIAAAFIAVGIAPRFAFGPVLFDASIIGLAILLVMAVIWQPWHRPRIVEPDALQKEGVAKGDILAVSSEDHYCRLFLADGTQRLLHARLADIVDLLDPEQGARIHRSHWCADRGVKAARRAGRGWEVILPCGAALRVSASYREEAQRRGWLTRNRLPG